MTLRDQANLRRALREVSASGSHTRAEWMQKLEAQNFLCFWCGSKLRDDSGKLRATKEHLTPITRGGSHAISNIVGACRRCNSQKHDRTAEEFRAYLAAKGQRISNLCTLPASTEEPLFARTIPPEVKKFTAPLTAANKFPVRPDHYWSERRSFLRWQLSTLTKREAETLPFLGIEVQRKA